MVFLLVSPSKAGFLSVKSIPVVVVTTEEDFLEVEEKI